MFVVNSTPGRAGQASKIIAWQGIARVRRRYPAWQRANDAARWVAGEVQIAPTIKLAASVFNVSAQTVKRARAMLDRANARRANNRATRAVN